MKIAELIERLGKATGPDRELDEWIVRILHPISVIETYCVGDDEKTVFHAAPLVQNKRILPRYTASIDAALTLVPDGCNWMFAKGQTRPDEPLFGVQIYPPNSGRMVEPPPPISESEHDLAAIVICIAALKARQAP